MHNGRDRMRAETFWLSVLVGLIAGSGVTALGAGVAALIRRKGTPRLTLQVKRLKSYEAGLGVVLVAHNPGPHVLRGVTYQVELADRLKPRRNVDVTPSPAVRDGGGEKWIVFPMPRDQTPPDVVPGDYPLAVYLIDGRIRKGEALIAKAWSENGRPTETRLRLDEELDPYADP